MKPRLSYPPTFTTFSKKNIAETISHKDIMASDDFGLTSIKRQIEQKQSALAEMFMRAILAFIDSIELTALEPDIMAGALEVFNAPDLAYSYLIWRSPTRGTVHVMAYRFTTGFVANDAAHSVTYDSAFESGACPEERWPEVLREYIEKGRSA